jgi:hypothetical protein
VGQKPALLLVLAVLATACGCADQGLKPESRANLGRIDAIVEVNQAAVIQGKPKIGYEPPPPAPKTFAEALGRVIAEGSAAARRQSLARKTDAELWKAEVPSLMAADARDRLQGLPGFDIHVRPEASYMPIDTRSFFDASTASAVLILTVAYYVDEDDLIFTGEVALFPKTEALRKLRRIPNDREPLGFGNTIFREHLRITVPANMTSGNVLPTFARAADDLASRVAAALARQK